MMIHSNRLGSPGRVLGAACACLGAFLALSGLFSPPAQAARGSAERTLAGIKIFSRQEMVLKKYGSPSQIVVGSLQKTLLNGGFGGPGSSQAGGPGGQGGPGGAGGFNGAMPGFGGAGAPGTAPAEFGGATGAPSPYSAPVPYGMPASGVGGAGAGPNGTPVSPQESKEVTWIYDRPDSTSVEFTLSSDGRVVQVRVTGNKGSVHTAKGIALGMKYGQVLAKYGYPESQNQEGAILNANYAETYHCAFQFYNGRLVAIIVAAVE